MKNTTNSPLSSFAENKGKNSKKYCKNERIDKVVPQKQHSYLLYQSGKKSRKCKQCHSGQVVPKKKDFLDTLEITPESSFSNNDEISFDQAGKYDKKKLKKRARSKHFSDYLMTRLASLNSPLEEYYWDTYHCSSRIDKIGNKVRSKFCKKRHCIICNRIRTAELIKKYYPTLQSWSDKSFLTLTIKNPKAENLAYWVNKMHKCFTQIKDSERKAGRPVVGIRKLEITFNSKENTFHPHFHFILETREMAEQIAKKWLLKMNEGVEKDSILILRIKSEVEANKKDNDSSKQYIKLNNKLEAIRKTLIADPQFQDIKDADKNACFELFKYFTKMTCSSSKDKNIWVKALDLIYQTLQGRRMFQPFGFVPHEEVPAPESNEEIEEKLEEIAYNWMKEFHDWISHETGEFLSGYEPTTWDIEKRKRIK